MSARRPTLHLVGDATRPFPLDVTRVVAPALRRLGCDVLVTMRAGQEATIRARLALRTELLVVLGDVALPTGAAARAPSARVIWLAPGEPRGEGDPDRLVGYRVVFVASTADADRARALGAGEVQVLPTLAVDGTRGWPVPGSRTTAVLSRTPTDDRQAELLDALQSVSAVELMSVPDLEAAGRAYARTRVAVVVAGHDASGHDAEVLAAAAAGAAVVAEPLHDGSLLDPRQHFVSIPSHDAGALVDRVGRLLGHPEEAAQLGRAARAHVRAAHTLDARLDAVLSHLPGRLRVDEARSQAVLRDPAGRETRSVSSFQRAVRERCQRSVGRAGTPSRVVVVGPGASAVRTIRPALHAYEEVVVVGALPSGTDGRSVVTRAEVFVPGPGATSPPPELGIREVRPILPDDEDRIALIKRFEVEPPPVLVALEGILRQGGAERVGLTGLDPTVPSEVPHLERMLAGIVGAHPDVVVHLVTGVGVPALPNVVRHLLPPALTLSDGLLGRLHAAGGPDPEGMAMLADLVAVDRAVRRILAVRPGPVMELLELLAERLGVVVDVVEAPRRADHSPPATSRVRVSSGGPADAPEGGYDLVLLLGGLEPTTGRAWRGPLPLRTGGYVIARAAGRDPVSPEILSRMTERPAGCWISLGETLGVTLFRLTPAALERRAA